MTWGVRELSSRVGFGFLTQSSIVDFMSAAIAVLLFEAFQLLESVDQLGKSKMQ